MNDIDWKTMFLTMSGRMPKSDFWAGAAILLVVGLVAGMLPLVGSLVGLALIVPWTCLMAKRLHDFGQSARLILIPAIPAAASALIATMTALAASNAVTAGAAFGMAGLALFVSGLAFVVGLGFLLWAGTRDGDAAANAYGPPVQPRISLG